MLKAYLFLKCVLFHESEVRQMILELTLPEIKAVERIADTSWDLLVTVEVNEFTKVTQIAEKLDSINYTLCDRISYVMR